MEKPKIAQKTPYVLDTEAGIHYWCSCGLSSHQPFCDGSHKKGTSFTPVKVNIEEAGKVAWCGCKHSANKPFCDGSHNKL